MDLVNSPGLDVSGAISNVNRLVSVAAANEIKESLISDGVTAGVLTIAKTGSTARQATFPDAAIIVAGSAAALTPGRVSFAATGGLLTDAASLTFSVPSFAQLVVGTNTHAASAFYTLNAAAGNTRSILGQTAGLNRWQFVLASSAAESGANAGSACSLSAYDDAGAFIDTPLSIPRAAGSAIALARPVSITNTTASTTTATGALVVSGGVGVAGNIYSGGYIDARTASAASQTFASTGAATSNFINHIGNRTTNVAFCGINAYNAAYSTAAQIGAIYFNRDAADRQCSIVFGTDNGTAYAERMRLNYAGSLLIGTTTDGMTAGGSLRVAKEIALDAVTAPTTAGSISRETNQSKPYIYDNGIGGWVDKCIYSQYASVTQSGIVTSQSLASATARGTRTLPANFFKQGKVLKFRLCGRYTSDVAAGNATVDVKLGSTTFRSTGSFTLDNSSTDLPWSIEGEIICYTTGATGTVEGVTWWAHGITGATGNFNIEPMAGTTTVTIDTTASQAFDVQWTATDAGTVLTCTCFRLWEVC